MPFSIFVAEDDPINSRITKKCLEKLGHKFHSSTYLSPRARLNSRIPIFVVSASPAERERDKYIDTGFDGWILKPVDFKRVGLLLKGIIDDEACKTCLFQPAKWEQGSWFEDRPSRRSPQRQYQTERRAAPCNYPTA
jgi:CheY-like chemotaxis protein